jgi:hypothetical protein
MRSLATMRRFGPWFLGLFLFAQIAGVIPLICSHTTHLFGGSPSISDGLVVNAPAHHNHHRHGNAHTNDECCALHQHLAGVLSHSPSAAPISLVHVVIVPRPENRFAAIIPVLLDRPPKFLSLI